jgi:hypothetical protein
MEVNEINKDKRLEDIRFGFLIKDFSSKLEMFVTPPRFTKIS